eukprot:TRINITY_DN4577_c0_g2_i1.p1 TRINITY_DN4577_c0_g2~~TRINITY_DN4577_c0_g2_i1.p1  ORF type:complete len:479 (-),score=93.56 TRINITY_DN4577_c0_g2_i1:118-1518(-)
MRQLLASLFLLLLCPSSSLDLLKAMLPSFGTENILQTVSSSGVAVDVWAVPLPTGQLSPEDYVTTCGSLQMKPVCDGGPSCCAADENCIALRIEKSNCDYPMQGLANALGYEDVSWPYFENLCNYEAPGLGWDSGACGGLDAYQPASKVSILRRALCAVPLEQEEHRTVEGQFQKLLRSNDEIQKQTSVQERCLERQVKELHARERMESKERIKLIGKVRGLNRTLASAKLTISAQRAEINHLLRQGQLKIKDDLQTKASVSALRRNFSVAFRSVAAKEQALRRTSTLKEEVLETVIMLLLSAIMFLLTTASYRRDAGSRTAFAEPLLSAESRSVADGFVAAMLEGNAGDAGCSDSALASAGAVDRIIPSSIAHSHCLSDVESATSRRSSNSTTEDVLSSGALSEAACPLDIGSTRRMMEEPACKDCDEELETTPIASDLDELESPAGWQLVTGASHTSEHSHTVT